MTEQNSPRAVEREDHRSSTNNDSPGELEVNSAFSFLRIISPDGPWLLHRFQNQRTTCNLVKNEEGLRRWLESDPEADWYVLIGETKREMHAKPKKVDMAGSRWVWVDIDPVEGETVEALESRLMQKSPHVVVRSGRGVWGLWELFQLGTEADVEAVNVHLAKVLGGDKCHNIDRVMRLPGTRNSKTGMIATWHNPGGTPLDIAKLPKSNVTQGAMVPVTGDIAPFDPTNIHDIDISQNARDRIMHPERFAQNGSRNENAFTVLQSLLGSGLEDGFILGVVLADLPVGDFFRVDGKGKNRANPEKFARQQLESAKSKLATRKASEPQWDLVSKTGIPVKSYNNAREALRHIGLDVWHDVFAGRDMIEGHAVQDFAGAVSDRALALVRDIVIERHGFDPGKENLRDAAMSVAMENRHDPVVDALDALEWDGVPRLETWLASAYGAENNPYSRAVGQLWLRAMCQRARQPGIKYDHMIILEGAQGLGKSLSLAILAGDRFSDAALFSKSNDRDRAELLQGSWINEVAELEGFTKRDVTDVKQFVTTQVDEFRPAYAHTKERFPRRGVLVGTTNEQNWNRDPTGARRFLPILCEKIDLDWLRSNRDQLLAEADALPVAPLVLPEEAWAMAAQEQAARRAGHSFDEFLADMPPEARFAGWERASTRYILDEILELPRSVLAQPNTTKILAERMSALGWEGPKPIVLDNGRRSRGYRRATDQPDLLEPPF